MGKGTNKQHITQQEERKINRKSKNKTKKQQHTHNPENKRQTIGGPER